MRLLACMLLALLAWPAAAHAQASAAPALAVLDHQARPDGSLDLLLRCAAPDPAGPTFTLLDAGGAPLPRPQITPAPAPAGLAIVIDISPSLAGEGSPHSTRLRDGILLAELLLARLPADSPIALIAAAPPPDAPPVAVGRAAIYPALRALAAADLAAARPAAPAHTLALARAQLEAAPPGSRHLAVITADPGAWVAAAPADGLTVALFDLAGSPGPAPMPQPIAHIPAHSAQSADLPGLPAAVDGYVNTVIDQQTHFQLRLPPGALAPGAGALTVIGCGGSAALLPASPGAPGWLLALPIGGAALAALAGGALWRRRRHPRPAPRPALPHPHAPRPLTTPFRAADLPTDRHGQAVTLSYRLVVSGPGGRAAHALGLGQWAIGRDPACAIVIDHPLLSALHARLSIAADRIELTDLDSTNGTAVGPARRRLAPDTPEPLDLDEIFWLGPDIHAALEAVDEGD